MVDNYCKIKQIRNNNKCLFENVIIECCNEKNHRIEKNHLVQKKSYLERISRNNKVLVWAFENRDYRTGKLVERSIKNANTFKVLCGNHDKLLFDEIENGKAFDENNSKQLFQFSLRAFVFSYSEHILKSNFDTLVSDMANKVADVNLYSSHVYLEEYKKLLEEEHWDGVESKVFKIEQKLPLISCYSGKPSYGINYPINFTSSIISLNVFPQDEGSIIILSYLKNVSEEKASKKYCEKVERLYKKNKKKFIKYILEFVIAFDHNVAINPSFWQEIGEDYKKNIENMAHIFPKCKNMVDGIAGFFKIKQFDISCFW